MHENDQALPERRPTDPKQQGIPVLLKIIRELTATIDDLAELLYTWNEASAAPPAPLAESPPAEEPVPTESSPAEQEEADSPPAADPVPTESPPAEQEADDEHDKIDDMLLEMEDLLRELRTEAEQRASDAARLPTVEEHLTYNVVLPYHNEIPVPPAETLVEAPAENLTPAEDLTPAEAAPEAPAEAPAEAAPADPPVPPPTRVSVTKSVSAPPPRKRPVSPTPNISHNSPATAQRSHHGTKCHWWMGGK